MLNKKHKLLELKTSILVDSLFIWNYKTKHKWRWIEFVDYKEYWPEDNVKNIDFIRSANEWKTLVKLYEEERELSVYFVFDFNENFNVNSISSFKMDIFYELFYLIWLSTISSWDKFWAFIYNNELRKLHYAKKWKQNFINIVQNIEEIWAQNITIKHSIIDKIKSHYRHNNFEEKRNNGLSYFNSLKINLAVSKNKQGIMKIKLYNNDWFKFCIPNQ